MVPETLAIKIKNGSDAWLESSIQASQEYLRWAEDHENVPAIKRRADETRAFKQALEVEISERRARDAAQVARVKQGGTIEPRNPLEETAEDRSIIENYTETVRREKARLASSGGNGGSGVHIEARVQSLEERIGGAFEQIEELADSLREDRESRARGREAFREIIQQISQVSQGDD